MKTATFHGGYDRGIEAGRRYATGTRRDRRAIRRQLAKAYLSGAAWWEGFLDGFGDAADQYAHAIEAGLVARTCNPHKLRRVMGRAYDAAS